MVDHTSTAQTNSYFVHFPTFIPDPTAAIEAEFARLAIHQGWSTKTVKQKQALARRRQECYEAEFHHHYGNNTTKLENWQSLCEEVGIRPTPPSINKCKKALSGVLVNLVDLMNQRRTGRPITRFKTVAEFRAYTKNKRVFSKQKAKADGFLKVLLRVIF